MKSRGLVEDEWVWFMSGFLPDVKAHTFHITDRGMKELKLLQSLGEPPKTYPLGYCILMCLKDSYPATAGQLAKMLGKDRGEVKRTMKSVQNKAPVDCLYRKTRTSFGQDIITHLYRITDLGGQVLEAGPNAYLRMVRCSRSTANIAPK